MLTGQLHAATVPPEAADWALEPPRLYFRDVPLASSGDTLTLTVDDDALDHYDIALYFLEHYDVLGTLTFWPGGVLTFVGAVKTDANDARIPLVVRCTAI
ncbi:hypothetical protein AB0883_20555 [Micromonospora sp. NPDC047812]|uniref:hypothetical protein n=1 Tax=Micromonospora sp. NPDC047812 TaxID=3155742 RepID=UPI003456D46B